MYVCMYVCMYVRTYVRTYVRMYCLCQSIQINNNKYVYRQSQVRMPNGSGVRWAECLLIIGTGCRVQVFSLILDSSVGLSAGIQSAGDWVSKTLWVRILHSAEEDNLSPFDSKIACLCQSIQINNKYVCMYVCVSVCLDSNLAFSRGRQLVSFRFDINCQCTNINNNKRVCFRMYFRFKIAWMAPSSWF